MFVIDFGVLGGERGVVLWRCAVIAIFWVLWLERNEKIFKDKVEEVGCLWDKIVFLAFWAKELCCVLFFIIYYLIFTRSDWRAICGL